MRHHKKGFSLIEAMVACGLLAIVIVSGAALTKIFKSSNLGLEQSIEAHDIMTTLALHLSSQRACHETLEGLSPRTAIVDQIYRVNPANAMGPIICANKYSIDDGDRCSIAPAMQRKFQSGLSISSIEIVDPFVFQEKPAPATIADGAESWTYLVVRFLRKDATISDTNKTVMGGNPFYRKIPIRYRNSGATIDRCASIPKQNYVWLENLDGDLELQGNAIIRGQIVSRLNHINAGQFYNGSAINKPINLNLSNTHYIEMDYVPAGTLFIENAKSGGIYTFIINNVSGVDVAINTFTHMPDNFISQNTISTPPMFVANTTTSIITLAVSQLVQGGGLTGIVALSGPMVPMP